MLLQAGVLPQGLQSLDGIPDAFRAGLTALASERIPNRMSTSRCVMTTLHLGRDDRGKENVVSPPFRTVSRFELEIGTALLVWFTQQRHNVSRSCGVGPPHTANVY